MRLILVLIPISMLFLTCQSQHLQQKILLEKTQVQGLVDSFSNSILVEELDGKRQWASAFNYLDSISVHRITYVSDGLKINGFVVLPRKKREISMHNLESRRGKRIWRY